MAKSRSNNIFLIEKFIFISSRFYIYFIDFKVKIKIIFLMFEYQDVIEGSFSKYSAGGTGSHSYGEMSQITGPAVIAAPETSLGKNRRI